MKKAAIKAFSALLVAVAASCGRETPESGIAFRTWAFPFAESGTRSLLDAPDIENRLTGVTLAAYAEGSLCGSAFFSGGFETMTLELDPQGAYTVYALVNMGDRTADLPVAETALPSLSYRIPSYTEGEESLRVRGLPMAGMLIYDGGTTVIPLKRLVARVTASVSCEYTDASIRSAKVFNLNRTLFPFAEASIATEEDILDGQEYQEGTGISSGTFVFYVPENCQGTISGISNSSGKSPDVNTEVNRRSRVLTYLETTVEVSGVYEGSLIYRSYLGKDATSNFDILRNAAYQWNLRYLEGGQQESGWKKEGELTKTLVRELTLEPKTASIVVGYTKTYAAWLTEIRLRDGVEISRTTTRLGGTDLYWSSSDGSKATVLEGSVTGVAPGQVTVSAFLKNDPSLSDTATLTVTSSNGGIEDGWDDGGDQILD